MAFDGIHIYASRIIIQSTTLDYSISKHLSSKKRNNPKYNFRFAIFSGLYSDIDCDHYEPLLLSPQTAAHRGFLRVKRAECSHSPDEVKDAAQGEIPAKQRALRGQSKEEQAPRPKSGTVCLLFNFFATYTGRPCKGNRGA